MTTPAGTPAIVLTGLPNSGKTTIGRVLVASLAQRDTPAELLDGDELRARLPPALGFSRADREAQAQRAGYLAELLQRHGIVPVLALVLPYESSRAEIARQLGPGALTVHLDAPLQTLIERDRKGVYADDRGAVTDPYETPREPALRLDTKALTAAQCADAILARIPLFNT